MRSAANCLHTNPQARISSGCRSQNAPNWPPARAWGAQSHHSEAAWEVTALPGHARMP